MPKRLMHILEGEALLNDASGLVCFRFAVAAVATGTFSVADASLTFAWLAVAGVAIGAGLTWTVSVLQGKLAMRFGEPSGSPILISLLIPFGAYMLAELVHASGILAAVAAGITMSFMELGGQVLAATRLQRSAVWDTMQFALHGVMFVLLGEQLPDILRGAGNSIEEVGHESRWWLVYYAFALSAGLILLRFAWVWTTLRITLYRRNKNDPDKSERPHWRLLLATSLAGVRGSITLAGVMTLPLVLPNGEPFPARDLTILLASTVILISLIAAGVGLPRLLGGMSFPEEPAERQQEDLARRAAATAAIAAIEKAQFDLLPASETPECFPQAAERVISLYEHRLNVASQSEDDSAAHYRDLDKAERVLRLAAIKAERRAIFELAQHYHISDEIARKIVREIDLVEARHR
ncbi:cation:proton antiporter [Pseudoduganella sp. UC29_106]|uniref:cation:proton antiporter n=1 Tax=Pseudoduganella sp. UC29_106 TaxID=3374553 RepID=UPI0037564913